jgi:hypothetical protein
LFFLFVGFFNTLWIYALFCLAGVIYIFAVIPETKDKTPEEVANHFVGRGRGSGSNPQKNNKQFGDDKATKDDITLLESV